MLSLLLAAHCALHVMASPGIAYPVPPAQHGATASAINQTEALLQQLADARLFSGAVAVLKAGTIVYARGYGQAVEVGLSPQPSQYCLMMSCSSRQCTEKLIIFL